MTIKVLVVDDEPLAREGVTLRLEQEADFQVVGECGNARDAIAMITELQPDLVFLDIKMPKVSGFDVIRAVGTAQMPLVIFLTAYDEFAVEAFQVCAMDYLLKPINSALFQESLSRVRTEIRKNRIALHTQQLNKLLDEVQDDSPAKPLPSDNSERLVIRSHGHVYFLKPQDILWVEAEGDYISIHTENRTHLVRETMRAMEKRLQTKGFARIHRSIIVNLKVISELLTSDKGDYEVVMEDGTQLKVGRSYRDALFESLQADL